MIELSHVYKTYSNGNHALRDLQLTINKGEFVFLTGPSGAGKSTLFKVISAFDKATSGSVIVNGRDLSKISSDQVPNFRREIGVVFQDFKLLKTKTVFENVALPLIIRNERPGMVAKKVEDVLQQVGLSAKIDDYPDFLSGGEQQRIAIARAIVHQPVLLIADEPTGNLDPQLSREIIDLFEKVAAKGTTVFIASHDQNLVQQRNKRTINLLGGQIEREVAL